MLQLWVYFKVSTEKQTNVFETPSGNSPHYEINSTLVKETVK